MQTQPQCLRGGGCHCLRHALVHNDPGRSDADLEAVGFAELRNGIRVHEGHRVAELLGAACSPIASKDSLPSEPVIQPTSINDN